MSAGRWTTPKRWRRTIPSFWARAARAIPIARKNTRTCPRGTAHPESACGAGGTVCRPSQRGGRHGERRGGQPQHHPHLELQGLDLHYDRTVTSAVANPVVEENGEKDSDYDFAVGSLDALDTDALARKAVDKARAKLGRACRIPARGRWCSLPER